jgi:hypothetical protein
LWQHHADFDDDDGESGEISRRVGGLTGERHSQEAEIISGATFDQSSFNN